MKNGGMQIDTDLYEKSEEGSGADHMSDEGISPSSALLKQQRRLRDAERHRKAYSSETEEQRKKRRERDALRHKLVYQQKLQKKRLEEEAKIKLAGLGNCPEVFDEADFASSVLNNLQISASTITSPTTSINSQSKLSPLSRRNSKGTPKNSRGRPSSRNSFSTILSQETYPSLAVAPSQTTPTLTGPVFQAGSIGGSSGGSAGGITAVLNSNNMIDMAAVVAPTLAVDLAAPVDEFSISEAVSALQLLQQPHITPETQAQPQVATVTHSHLSTPLQANNVVVEDEDGEEEKEEVYVRKEGEGEEEEVYVRKEGEGEEEEDPLADGMDDFFTFNPSISFDRVIAEDDSTFDADGAATSRIAPAAVSPVPPGVTATPSYTATPAAPAPSTSSSSNGTDSVGINSGSLLPHPASAYQCDHTSTMRVGVDPNLELQQQMSMSTVIPPHSPSPFHSPTHSSHNPHIVQSSKLHVRFFGADTHHHHDSPEPS